MVNTKALVACGVSLLVCLYLLYSWASARASTRSGTLLKRQSTWKTHDFVDIPADVVDRMKSVAIEEKHVNVNVEGQIVKIFYREVVGSGKAPPVVMLHGASSSSEVWVKVRTMHLIGAMEHRAIAVDLPGWANSKDSQLKAGASDVFLSAFLESINVDTPMIISASMSGRYSLPYMMKPDPVDCGTRLSAYVALAPVDTQKFEHAQYHRCEVPALLSFGTKDKTLGLTSVGNLRNMPMSEILPMDGAGHANYEERPDDWNRQLYNFILAVERIK